MNSEVTKRNTAQILPSGELTVWGLKRQKGKQLPGSNECYNREPPGTVVEHTGRMLLSRKIRGVFLDNVL